MAVKKEASAQEANQFTVKVKLVKDGAVLPTYAHEGDACFDIYAAEDVIISPGETKIVPTGIVAEVPSGYVLRLYPRSGLSLRTPLRQANATGIIDATYRGEIGVIIENTALYNPWRGEVTTKVFLLEKDKKTDSNEGDSYQYCHSMVPVNTWIIRKGERIAQGEIAPVITVGFQTVEELSETERGDGGFGSSGVN